MKWIKPYILLILIYGGGGAMAQSLLSKEEAVSVALDYNFQIKVARNNAMEAKNSSGILNTGYIPSVRGISTADYSETDFNSRISGGGSKTYRASAILDYLIYDGLGRKYNYKILKENFQLSELEARRIIELTLLDLFFAYYEVSRLEETEYIQEQSLNISKTRLERFRYSYYYGQGNKLAMLNAEVDANRDSTTLLDIRRLLANSKRDLNLILGRDVNENFITDTTVFYNQNLQLDSLSAYARRNNVNYLQAQSNLTISQHLIKTARAQWHPRISIIGTYSWTEINTESPTIGSPSIAGPSYGAALNWNIFDGGLTLTAIQNAKISARSRENELERTELELERNLRNAWETYQNALLILAVERQNVGINKLNFQRSADDFRLGLISSVQFREAQINLLTAVNNKNMAKYESKLSELKMLQLAGKLLDSQF